MQVILMRKHCGWADNGLGGGGIGGSPASDGDGDGRMAGWPGTGISAEKVSALGAGGGGDGAGVKNDDIGKIRRGRRIADTTEHLLHLKAFVVVDFAPQSDDRKRRHERGIVPEGQASIFPDGKLFLNPWQLLRYNKIVRRANRGSGGESDGVSSPIHDNISLSVSTRLGIKVERESVSRW